MLCTLHTCATAAYLAHPIPHPTPTSSTPSHSANVHEARGYNRLAGMARGRILLLIQDDELLDANDGTRCAWLRNAVTVFDRFPAVGVVGMKMYLWAFGPNNTHDGMYFRDPATQLEVQFVLNADYAPLAMRKWVAWGRLGLRHGQGRCT